MIDDGVRGAQGGVHFHNLTIVYVAARKAVLSYRGGAIDWLAVATLLRVAFAQS